ncbi:MAG TPA: GntR family transcriptional regulator [Pararhizobium sp.]|uniref:GntR family transcriptional regulator n=1 Tax=Pararhizobium sp. TaxID=1977563 RepID=UPI002C54AF07|nr:GntR family transcriptional regulator [Pararhizobium sp.]HTO34170.1 GntR family transcriptional regulator [Pararhizobium sp.]
MDADGIDDLVGGRLAAVSSADAVYELLRSLILDGKIEAGQRLREVEVAQRLGVSRTPLREAFTRLISNRLLVRTSSGVVVADVKSALKGIRAIRIALEGYATRLAVPHLNEEDFKVLEASIKLALTLPEEARTERVRNNNVFHGRIYNACGVPELQSAIDNYAGFFMSEANLAALSRAQSQEVIQDHVKLLEAIKARDAEEAEQLMRAHLIRGFNQPMG